VALAGACRPSQASGCATAKIIRCVRGGGLVLDCSIRTVEQELWLAKELLAAPVTALTHPNAHPGEFLFSGLRVLMTVLVKFRGDPRATGPPSQQYARNQRHYVSQRLTGPNVADRGRERCAPGPSSRGGELRGGLMARSASV